MTSHLTAFLFITTLPCLADIEVSVAKNGPIASLAAARDAVRTKRKAGEQGKGIISIQGGNYDLAQALELDAQDSDLTIRGDGTARPKFLGGTIISGFLPHQGSIVKADVSSLTKKEEKYRQLLAGGERMILARHPNFDAKDPLYGGWAFVDAIPPERAEALQWNSEFYLKPQDVRKWAHPEDVEVDIFAQYGWWNFIQPVQSLDAASRKLTTATKCSYAYHPNNRYHFQNALEELDAPGEWFLDPRTSTLYLWPASPVEKQEVRLVTLDSFIKVNGAKNVHIENLSFTGCNGTALSFQKTEHCLVAGCELKTVGGFKSSAISFNGGSHNIAQSNDISDTGAYGISLSGGDRIKLEGGHNEAVNNHIHHIGVFNKNACGVSVNGVNHIISHNLIHDGPRMGVEMAGNNLIVEYNHLHHLVMETQDGGALYTGGRDWLGSRGSIWRYNRIHDIVGLGQEKDGLKHPWFTFGIYPDDNTGGVDIIGNLVYRVAHTPIHMHNSRDCVVENNIFAFGEKFQFDLHGWLKTQNYWTEHGPTMVKGYESVIDQPVWKKLRGMDLHPKDAFREDGTMMSGNIVQRNIIVSNAAGAKYGDLRNVSNKWNTIDGNLAWNIGYPVTTGMSRVGPDKGEPVLKENFDAISSGGRPKGWDFNSHPTPDLKLAVSDGSLHADVRTSADPKNDHTTFHGPDLPFKPGSAYRVRLRIRSTEPECNIGISFAAYKGGAGYWQTKTTSIVATPEWKEIEAAGAMPAESDPAYKPWMTAVWLRIDCPAFDKGQVIIDDVKIHEAEPLSAWASWQAEGWDEHGIVADPLFEDVAKDDFRLKPESPAIKKLGFKPLPIEQMGLVRDEWRKQ